MGARLKATVIVNGRTYLAGAEVPPEVAAQITNPDAIDLGDAQEETDKSVTYPHEAGGVLVLGPGVFATPDRALINWDGEMFVPESAIAVLQDAQSTEPPAGTPLTDDEKARIAESAAATPTSSTPPADTPPAPERPAEAGPGSSKDKWAAYAESIGVAVPEGATRDEIIAAVDAPK